MTDDEDEQEWLASYNLLTAKPVIFAANVSEDDLADDGANNEGVQAVREYAASEDCEVFVVCAEIEEEISELDDDEKAMFLEELGLKESGLEKLIQRKLPSSRSDQLPDGGRTGSPCMDDQERNESAAGGRKDPYGF